MDQQRRRSASTGSARTRARSLERRIVAAVLGSTFAALTVVFAIYQWSNWSADRQDLAAHAADLARVIGPLARAALGGVDHGALADAEGLLRGNSDAVAASYIAADGRRLELGATAGAPATALGVATPTILFRAPGVEAHVPHYAGKVRLGEIVVRASDHAITQVRLRNILIALALTLLGAAAAGAMARLFVRRALRPLRDLNAAMEVTAASRDFAAEARIAVDDEVGQLTRNFNHLLRALREYDENLHGALAEATAARETAEDANRLKSQFLANMGHEIRTPLNGVLGMAQALLMERLSARQRERVEVIRSSGEALLCVLSDLLDVGEIESGRLQLQSGPFDLETLVQESCAVAATLAESKGLSFEAAVEPEARGAWIGDSVRLRQVLYNLISNGLKFTAAGSVRVRAGLAAGGEGLVLTVADTGIGVSAEALPLLFGKFVQGESGATRRFGGAGLGLAICQSLVQLMGGRIEVESRPGEGSVFSIHVPLARAQAAVEAEAGDEVDLPALRVLVAEDNETNQRVVRTVLNALGVEPVIVPDGAAAVEAWMSGEFDLVLMDIQMPVRDGVAATRDIRRLEAEGRRRPTRIVALTANAMPHQAAEYVAAGMDDVVPKPIMIEQLHAALMGAAVLRAA